MMMLKIVSRLHSPYVPEITPAQHLKEKDFKRVPVWYWPNTLRKLSQRDCYNSRVPELG